MKAVLMNSADKISEADKALVPGSLTVPADSISSDMNLEHIFFQIPTDGAYQFSVHQRNSVTGLQKYAVAWWAFSNAPANVMNGDFNFDGFVDADDIPEMLKGLTDLNDFKTKWGLTDQELINLADVNHSGTVTNADIQAELDLVASLAGSGSLSSVPEPSTWLLLAFGLPIFKPARRK